MLGVALLDNVELAPVDVAVGIGVVEVLVFGVDVAAAFDSKGPDNQIISSVCNHAKALI